jgi:hypothetical protein
MIKPCATITSLHAAGNNATQVLVKLPAMDCRCAGLRNHHIPAGSRKRSLRDAIRSEYEAVRLTAQQTDRTDAAAQA